MICGNVDGHSGIKSAGKPDFTQVSHDNSAPTAQPPVLRLTQKCCRNITVFIVFSSGSIGVVLKPVLIIFN